MFEDMELEFGTEEEIRSRPPAGTVANIQVRPDKDGNMPQSADDFKTGESKFGPWMIVNFEVVDGQFKGEWASTILNLKTDDRRFRATFQAITGVDISQGGTVSFADFMDKLIHGVFEAEIGPERRKVKDDNDQSYLKAVESGSAPAGLNPGDFYETGFTSVQKVLQRVGERGAFASSDPTPTIDAAPAPESIDDEDVPF